MHTDTHTARCLRPGCGRKLTSAKSIAAGYGPVCRARIRAAALAEAVKGFAATAVEKARELISDGGLIPTGRPGVFRAVSSKGDATYLTHPATCACAAQNANDEEPERFEARLLARAALEAAAPILAEEVAKAITEYAGERQPIASTADGMMRRSAWRGHFHIAAHIALGLPLCANCALPIMRLASSSTGWTHDSGSPVEGWQGIRCPGKLCGATPCEVPGAR